MSLITDLTRLFVCFLQLWSGSYRCLVDLFLLVHGELAWAHVYKEKKTTTTFPLARSMNDCRSSLTQLTKSGRNRTLQSPCVGGEHVAIITVSIPSRYSDAPRPLTYRPEVVHNQVEDAQ